MRKMCWGMGIGRGWFGLRKLQVFNQYLPTATVLEESIG